MKKYNSNLIKVIALICMSFPLFYSAFALFVFRVPTVAWPKILISPFFYLPLGLIMLAGYGIWEMSRWAWYILVPAMLLHAYQNAYILANYSDSEDGFLLFVIASAIQLLIIFLVKREVRVPYFFPRVRWWESNPRFKPTYPVSLVLKEQSEREAEILDLSPLGCFIKTPEDFELDTPIEVRAILFGRTLDLHGKVVWKTFSTVTRPKGIGVKFFGLQRSQKRNLQLVHKRLKQISVLLGRMKYIMSPEQLIQELDLLSKTPIQVGRHKRLKQEIPGV